MSIIKKNNKVILNFGKGDIDIWGGYSADGFSVISFENIEPREIGAFRSSNGKVGILEEAIEKSEVVMTFSKKESLDALIHMLNVVRDKMEDK
ncbi:MAG: hypothetical protein E7C50_00310 [Clostridium sp.]|uniref:hypothetical protein n=1 Tax=Clostridium sp. TaxID=1506 RepID=UPI002901BAF9|nr:hypothetical protein [Clostridium sp.]MDU2674206.1 hypothetical protein [Clostridium sp.]MDU2680301.1 hypothetical protein [Clostridium sp.]